LPFSWGEGKILRDAPKGNTRAHVRDNLSQCVDKNAPAAANAPSLVRIPFIAWPLRLREVQAAFCSFGYFLERIMLGKRGHFVCILPFDKFDKKPESEAL
jgi:hypothetical protein